MSRPAEADLVFVRGDSYRVQLRHWNDLQKTQPHDLTGCIARAEIRRSPASLDAVALACTIATNVVSISVSAAQAETLPSTAEWDLELTYPSGEKRTTVAGDVYVRGDITQ